MNNSTAGSPPALQPHGLVNTHLLQWFDTLPKDGIDLRGILAAVERLIILRALRESDGVMRKAASLLGISRSDMSYKIRKHKLRRHTKIGRMRRP
ncbi:MAG TPA: helix-turn-helix domain-containing protein [Candidatus Nanoarchaeia archaeon]|nr:helix-turn-helix domain-containing protein [Candidatus Nanoarchaeia archaeon]